MCNELKAGILCKWREGDTATAREEGAVGGGTQKSYDTSARQQEENACPSREETAKLKSKIFYQLLLLCNPLSTHAFSLSTHACMPCQYWIFVHIVFFCT